MNLAHIYFQKNQGNQNTVAYCDEHSSVTYAELETQSRQFAQLLNNQGFSAGDHAVISLLDRVETVMIVLAVWYAGGVVAMINPRDLPKNIQDQCDLVSPKIVINESNFADLIAQSKSLQPLAQAVDRNYEDMVTMWFTSGTTGHAKAVMHTIESCLFASQSAAEMHKMTPQDRVYVIPKLFFAYGFIYTILVSIYAGATAFLDSDISLPQTVKRNIDTFKPTWLFAVPVIYSQLISRMSKQHLDMTCVSAGDRLPQPVFDKWTELTGQRIHNLLGSTEFCIITYNESAQDTSLGKPMPGYQARLVDAHGNVVPAGQPGRLQISGRGMSVGYYKDEFWTKQTFNDFTWANSNDMLYQDEQGNLHHLGRANDVIKTPRGFINPGEIEESLLSFKGVEQAAVVSRPDANGVEYIEAYVVTVPDYTLQVNELKHWIKQRHDIYAVPAHIHLVTELPRTQTGKVQRYKLREQM
jgi:acyl-coenzyme A synthetase/AMP-(fatty) acid ligase